MAGFILTWNPTMSWRSGRYERAIAETARGRVVHGSWSVGNRRRGIAPGDRAFLLRQHDERGIVAAGAFRTGQIDEDEHWDGSGRRAWYVRVDWHLVVNTSDRLPVEILKARVPDFTWERLRRSGVQLRPRAAVLVAKLWEDHVRQLADRR